MLPPSLIAGLRLTSYHYTKPHLSRRLQLSAHLFLSRRLGTAKAFRPVFVVFENEFLFFPVASRLQVELTIVVKFGDLLFIPSRFNAAAMPATCMNSPGLRDKKSTTAFGTLMFLYLPVLARVGASS